MRASPAAAVQANTRPAGRAVPRPYWSSTPATAGPSMNPAVKAKRAREVGYNPALRQVSNHLVGILHGCLKTRTLYHEATAWSQHTQTHAA